MIFELIVVDTPEQAKLLNGIVPANTPQRRIYAVFVGQDFLGLHSRGYRPNKLTRWHSELTTEMQKQWESEVLLQAVRITKEDAT